jgi:hypothetical protein
VDPDTTNSIMRNNLSAIEGDGDHCRIPVPAAVSIASVEIHFENAGT